MSIHIYDHVWQESRHGGGDLLLLLALADYAGDHGIAWPAVGTLARKIRQTDRHVPRLLKRLSGGHKPELEIMRGAGPCGAHLYRITLPSMKHCPTCQQARAEGPAFRQGGGDILSSPCTSVHLTSAAETPDKMSGDPSRRDPSKETNTTRAREDAPLVVHEEPPDEPQAPEDETPCVCEDQSMAEDPEAPGADPEPEPQAVPGPEPLPEPEAFAWEEPPACERFDVLAVRTMNQPMCPHVQCTLDLMAEVDYPCDERFYRADPQGRVHAFAHDLTAEEQRHYLRYRMATEVGERQSFLAPATCLSPAWVAGGLPLARQWVAKQNGKAQQNTTARFEPPPPEEQLSPEEVKALCAATIDRIEHGPGRRRRQQTEEPPDAL